MSKFQKRVLDYVRAKPILRIRNGENGFSVKQIVKHFRNNARWLVHVEWNDAVFTDRAKQMRQNEALRNFKIEFIDIVKDEMYPEMTYQMRTAKKKMDIASFWTRRILSLRINKNVLDCILTKYLHPVDWIDQEYNFQTFDLYGDAAFHVLLDKYQCIYGTNFHYEGHHEYIIISVDFEITIRMQDSFDAAYAAIFHNILGKQKRALSYSEYVQFFESTFKSVREEGIVKLRRLIKQGFNIYSYRDVESCDMLRYFENWQRYMDEEKRVEIVNYLQRYFEQEDFINGRI